MFSGSLPVFLYFGCLLVLGCGLLSAGRLLNPRRPGRVKHMPYESGMDPIHDTRRRFDVRFHLLAIAFLVFDVELLFLYPWAVVVRAEASTPVAAAGASVPGPAVVVASSAPAATPHRIGPRPVFAGGMVFIAVLALGFVYDWRKGVFGWR